MLALPADHANGLGLSDVVHQACEPSRPQAKGFLHLRLRVSAVLLEEGQHAVNLLHARPTVER